MSIFTKMFGTASDRILKSMKPVVDHINSLESGLQALTDAEIRQKTDTFRERLAAGETLDDLLPEAFAVAREASRRVLLIPNADSPHKTMRHFDVQLIGGIVLHRGNIAEMTTGEGKTLVATLPAYLNALGGKGVHVVTVNDYLANRDMNWMLPMYEFLGLSAGAIQSNQSYDDKRAAYKADITYGTNNEFGFDYLRDNMRVHLEEQVQGALNYAIVDEVDSILIDEARTPLIISGPSDESTEKYFTADKIARKLKPGKHYEVKEKEKSTNLTDEGISIVEKELGVDSIYSDIHMDWPHYIEQSLRAHSLFIKDTDYVVQGKDVIIVDEFTGRLMEGRMWSDGLHQAIQAKEHLKIKEESQTLATITLQNFYRLYNKLSGMTGTAFTEAAEFAKIYGLGVDVIPTNKPLQRLHHPDRIYGTAKEKETAIVEEIAEVHEKGQPILVGTISIEKSEMFSNALRRRGIEHEVLNAKNHEREAAIIAKAGQKGNVTIATNMAGRGTDIVLGEGVKELGGLHVIGTERHEARRIDNQLRGRTGRQGDPGSSRFYVSLEDDLMRIFAPERVGGILRKFGMTDGMAIEHSMVSKSIERAQKKVEQHNFEIRKNLLEYDEVMDEQRKTIYTWRQRVLAQEALREDLLKMIEESIVETVDYYVDRKLHSDEWDMDSLLDWYKQKFGIKVDLKVHNIETKEDVEDLLLDTACEAYGEKEKEIGAEELRKIEQILLLEKVDTKWKDHLYAMDHLKSGIGLRGYAQVDPKIEYKREALIMFESMMSSIREEVTDLIFKLRVRPETIDSKDVWNADNFVYQDSQNTMPEIPAIKRKRDGAMTTNSGQAEQRSAPIRTGVKVGRNQPCPCGSGKKYKQCCGKS
ncbi:preprotein translocase subunit SecA [Candidatus Brocadiaceae bacterium S225]|uniref:Protein translocase subunit SecA n=1 Tax=Candidatus Scalindua brodae TaxID=237368 RepID=A0A0B0EF71_9BACT|nr:MAG: preprotein translocase subunit SecA [Candidatus Scalindua brodae]TWU36361.1 preprotein translocase subunit SecA [Candidatus Brocadiaceae bacterium S225]